MAAFYRKPHYSEARYNEVELYTKTKVQISCAVTAS